MRYVTAISILTIILITGCITKSPYPLPQNRVAVTHNITNKTNHKIPRPFCHQTNQPNCLAAAFQLLSASQLNTNLNGLSYWEPILNVQSNGFVSLSSGLYAWNTTFPSNPLIKIYSDSYLISYKTSSTNTNTVIPSVKQNYPYLWCGLSKDNVGHAAVAYFSPSNFNLLHLFIDPTTNTNYTESIPYSNFFSRTWLIIDISNVN